MRASGSFRTAATGTRFMLLDHPVHDGADISSDEFIITRVVHRERSNEPLYRCELRGQPSRLADVALPLR